MVVRLKNLKSSGRCHGISLPRPITRFNDIAAMVEKRPHHPEVPLHVDRIGTDDRLVGFRVDQPIGMCSIAPVDELNLKPVVDTVQSQPRPRSGSVGIIGDSPKGIRPRNQAPHPISIPARESRDAQFIGKAGAGAKCKVQPTAISTRQCLRN